MQNVIFAIHASYLEIYNDKINVSLLCFASAIEYQEWSEIMDNPRLSLYNPTPYASNWKI